MSESPGTEGVLARRNANRIKRHKDALYCIVSSLERAKRKVEELKITGEIITNGGANTGC